MYCVEGTMGINGWTRLRPPAGGARAATCLGAMILAILLGPAAKAASAPDAVLEAGCDGKIFSAGPAKPWEPSDLTTPRDLYVEPSTLHSLGFQWNIQGDDNRDGRVEVQWRREGATEWRRGMDLLRISGERVHQTTPYTCGNLYAGSILFLDPGTAYEVQLTLYDPDHTEDGPLVARRFIRASTKSLPRRHDGNRVIHVYPAAPDGPPEPPVAADLHDALDQAEPGDHIALHKGTYGGGYAIRRGGTREKPLVIRPAGDGPVIFQGSNTLFNVSADYVWIEGLTIRNYGWTVLTAPDSRVRGLTVSRCRFEDCNVGVFTRSRRNRDIYVADNVFVGTQGSWHRHYPPRDGLPYKAVWMTGQGIDVCHNRIENHWDGLSVANGGPTDSFEEKMCGMDFYGNDIQGIVDDNEADYGQHNIRFFHNRLLDHFMGLSAQPVWGGPAYFVRNVLYNITTKMPFKLCNSPAGVLIYHNTCCSAAAAEGGVAHLLDTWSNVHVHNNLFLGLATPVLWAGPLDPDISTLDYNGYSVDVQPPTNAAWGRAHRIYWGAFDPAEVAAKGPKARVRYTTFETFESFADATGKEEHHVAVTWTDLQNITPPEGEAVEGRSRPGDFRLRSGSAAIDRGVRIPNINDDYTGKAPDLGAIEFERAIPHYGPRPAP